MKNKSPRLIFSLTGGLGNQLFQVAAAISFSGGEPVELEWGVGKPRLSRSGIPEVTSFTLPNNVKLRKKVGGSWLMAKSSGYLLRMGIAPRTYEKLPMVKPVITALANSISLAYFKEYRKSYAITGLGYSEVKAPPIKSFFVGYFQTFRWASEPDTNKQLRNLSLRNRSTEVEEFQRLSLVEKPLVVHIRLGDYKSESDFGLLHPDYYLENIADFWKSGKYKKIWIFSDEIESARKYFLDFDQNSLRYITEVDNSASATLEVMRYGHGFIIGNSSFSWWGAYLAYAPDVEVNAPTPWFRNIESPVDLIPPEWMLKAAKWGTLEDTLE